MHFRTSYEAFVGVIIFAFRFGGDVFTLSETWSILSGKALRTEPPLTRATPGSPLFAGQLVLGLADAVVRGSSPTLRVLGGRRVGGRLYLLGSKVQVRNGLQQLGLCLLQQPVDVLGAVLGQAGPLLLPVPLCRLRGGSRDGFERFANVVLRCDW